MAYLDHAATTPLRAEAAAALVEQMGQVGNASSLHAAGRRARRVVEESRESIAGDLGCRPGEVVFTSGGTEADNLALKGLFRSRRDDDPRRVRILASAVEHHAAMDPVVWLAEADGAVVEWVPVDALGRVDVAALAESIAADPDSVALVTVMWANNEVGTLQPVDAVVAAAARHGIPVHTDAVQAVGILPVPFDGVASAAVSGHKLGGPQGIGALILERGLTPVPLLHGGGQERDVRSGTLDAPAIAGFAAALAAATAERDAEANRIAALRDDLIARVRAAVPDAVLNGDPDPAGRLPGNAHFSFPGCEGDALLMLLDARGVECSTGSACSSGVAQPSHVLLAMGVDAVAARSSLRFTLGHTSTSADVDALIDALPAAVERARRAPRLAAQA